MDPDLFFPAVEDSQKNRAAKKACAECPVSDECLAFAIRTEQRAGIWGGTTTRERRKIQRGTKRSTT